MPSQRSQGVSILPSQVLSQTYYSVKSKAYPNHPPDVLLINKSAAQIMDDISNNNPRSVNDWKAVGRFVGGHQSHRRRQYKGEIQNVKAVDLIVFDVPENLPVPFFDDDAIPEWNVLPIDTDPDSQKSESPWIHKHFEWASEWIADDGVVLVFYPDSKFILSELEGWSHWAGFKVQHKWIVMNDLKTNSPDFPDIQTTVTNAMLFAREENAALGIPASRFHFYEQSDLEAKGVDMVNLGFLVNKINQDNWTVREVSGGPWRGPREKSEDLFIGLLDLLSQEEDIVMDLTTSTGKLKFRHTC